jgi:hypothetical protein
MWNLRGRGPRGPLDYGSVRADASREVLAMREFPGKARSDGASPARRWGRGGPQNGRCFDLPPSRKAVLGRFRRSDSSCEARKRALYWPFNGKPALYAAAVNPKLEGLAYNFEPLEMRPQQPLRTSLP